MLFATWYKEKLSYSVWQSLNHIYFNSILLADPLTEEGGEETGVPRKKPWQRVSENDTY